MKRFIFVIELIFSLSVAHAIEPVDTLPDNSATTSGYQEMKRLVRGFDRLDTTYIEPQHYIFTVMLQATHTYDLFKLRSTGPNAQSMTFAPDMHLKVGPYFGWKWFFAGYTFELNNISFNKLKQQIDLSIYSSQIGVDLFYRRTGEDYKIRNAHIADNIDGSLLNGTTFNGVKAGITGFNVYYIFNHGRFSYPAAFAQSTMQKVSCGSWMAGVGYTHNSLSFDCDKLQQLIDSKLGGITVPVDSGLMFNSVKYNDFNISGGYAYNWVFSKHFLLAGSIQAAIAYKQSQGNMDSYNRDLGFYFNNINLDGIGRFGIVYNNMRWFAGASVIVHTNNYHKSRFSTNNTFGSMNMYVGYYFGLKKKYRKK